MESSETLLGTYTFDKDAARLRGSDGQLVALRHKSLEVLNILAKNSGKTVLRDDLVSTVWGSTHVSEDSLAKCVADIRKAIGDHDKQLIQTIPRKGYKLVEGPDSNRVRPRLKYAAFAVLLMAVGVLASLSGQFWISDSDRPVIAVLRFKDLSPQPHRDYLSDAISEELIVNLARYPHLIVISENSSFQLRDDPVDFEKASQILGADFILDGSQQFDGSTIRVTAQLIDTKNGEHVWTESVDAELGGIFTINEALSQRVAHAIDTKVTDIEIARHSDNEDEAEAMFRYFKSRQLALQTLSRENTEQSMALNRKSVEDYPEQPWGHIGLAFNLRLIVRFKWADEPLDDVLERAMYHAQTAVRLAPKNYASHFVLSNVFRQSGDLDRAVHELHTALALNPSAVHALNALASLYLYLGRTDEALDVLAKAEVIDPLGTFVHHWAKAWVLWQDRQCEKAFLSLNNISKLPTETYKLLAVINVCLDDQNAAKEAFQTFASKYPDWNSSKEAKLHSPWAHQPSLDRWLSELRTAGLSHD